MSILTSIKSVIANLSNYIKPANWLQYVGIALAVIGIAREPHGFAQLLSLVGLGVFGAGKFYNKIYPS